MKLNLKKQFSTLALVTSFVATASMSLAGECRVAEASMDKPGGFPDRALTMIVPYGPGEDQDRLRQQWLKRSQDLPV